MLAMASRYSTDAARHTVIFVICLARQNTFLVPALTAEMHNWKLSLQHYNAHLNDEQSVMKC